MQKKVLKYTTPIHVRSLKDLFVVHKHDDWVFTLLCDIRLPQTLLQHWHIIRHEKKFIKIGIVGHHLSVMLFN